MLCDEHQMGSTYILRAVVDVDIIPDCEADAQTMGQWMLYPMLSGEIAGLHNVS